jgi:hypothetical protein
VTNSESLQTILPVSPPFDLARTVAPAWWARGRWPNVDARRGTFLWVGWESGQVSWRSIRQIDAQTLEVFGSRRSEFDASWAAAVLGTNAAMPIFGDPIMAALARKHAGLRAWSAGSLFEGVVSSIVGQSISVAAAATTERRLCERFNRGLDLDGRQFWPPPRPEQLASSSAAFVRESGVTTKRAEALVAVGTLFASALARAAFEADPSHAGRRASARRSRPLSRRRGSQRPRPGRRALEAAPRLGGPSALVGPSRLRRCKRYQQRLTSNGVRTTYP